MHDGSPDSQKSSEQPRRDELWHNVCTELLHRAVLTLQTSIRPKGGDHTPILWDPLKLGAVVPIVMSLPGARRLDKELHVLERRRILSIKDGPLWWLDWVLVLDHILDELSHHLSRNAGAIAGVLEHQRTRVLPVCLEAYLLGGATRVDRSVEQRHSG